MGTKSYLDGALTVETLGADAVAGRFRAEDARGAVAWLARGEPFAYLHAVEFRTAGVRRGFHVHHRHVEKLYVVAGTLRLVASCGGETAETTLRAGDLATFAAGVGRARGGNSRVRRRVRQRLGPDRRRHRRSGPGLKRPRSRTKLLCGLNQSIN